MKKIDYKKEYEKLRKSHDMLIKHKTYCPKKCKYCKEWYREVLENTERVRNKKVRENLIELWETLWLNNCHDFDIIADIFKP